LDLADLTSVRVGTLLRALLAFDISANLLFNLLANLPGYLVTLFPLHFGANIAGNIDALSAGYLVTDGPRHVAAPPSPALEGL
jgi:hypothetical protein